MDQLKEGNERPVHITLSHDDTMRLKAAVDYYAKWHGTDYGQVERVYMVLDAAIGAAGYYPESQPGVYGYSLGEKAAQAERMLENLREELSRMACEAVMRERPECASQEARDEGLTEDMWCAQCRARRKPEARGTVMLTNPPSLKSGKYPLVRLWRSLGLRGSDVAEHMKMQNGSVGATRIRIYQLLDSGKAADHRRVYEAVKAAAMAKGYTAQVVDQTARSAVG